MKSTHTVESKHRNELVSLSERESLLRAQPGFSELQPSDLAQLVGFMHEIHVEPGDKIVKEGDLIDSVFIIASGSAEVTQEVIVNKKVGETLLASLHSGDSIGLKGGQFFSETGLRTATVTASAPCLLLQIYLKDLKRFFEERPDLLQNLQSKSTWMLRMQMIKEAVPFAKLDNKQLAGLVSNLKELVLKPGQKIFKQGDVAENCYLICSGKVEITSVSDDGKEKINTVLESQSLIGEAALSSPANYTSSAKTLTDCTLLVMDQNTLQELALSTEMNSKTSINLIEGNSRPYRHENVLYHHRKTSDGIQITTLKDSSTSKYLQLSEEGWFIWSQMNGNLTIAELSKLVQAQYSNSHATTEDVKRIIQELSDAGFATIDAKYDHKNGAATSEEKNSLLSRIFYFSYFFKNADSKIEHLYNAFGFLLVKIPIVILQFFLVLAGFVAFYKSIKLVDANITSILHPFLWFFTVMFIGKTLLLITPLVKAFTIKHFDYDVPQFGIKWQQVGPVGVVDASGLWIGPRWHQMVVSFSGIFSNLVIAALLSIYALYTTNTSLTMFAWFCALLIYLKTIHSLDPMQDLEGYEFLSQSLDSPNLRELSLQWVLGKSTPSARYNQAKIFWGYTLGYLLVTLYVTLFLIHEILANQKLPLYFDRYLIAGIIICYLLEIFFVIKNQNHSVSSQIL